MPARESCLSRCRPNSDADVRRGFDPQLRDNGPTRMPLTITSALIFLRRSAGDELHALYSNHVFALCPSDQQMYMVRT